MNKAAVKEFEICCGKDIKPDDWLWVQTLPYSCL